MATPGKLQGQDVKNNFFMALAFWSSSRSKDNRYQVGACLVTLDEKGDPQHVVALGYNGMPVGHGFDDESKAWGRKQGEYVCHAELNTIIAGFRRCVDLSKCALYVNYSPCVECSKLVIQSGIKKVVYARHYRKKKHETYDHLVELRDMKITDYKFIGERNNAKVMIRLKSLDFTLTHSYKPPNKDRVLQGVKDRRGVDLPLDDYFMALAILATTRYALEKSEVVDESPDNKNVYGACIVMEEPRRAISVGCKGFPEDYKGKKKKYECCAESNAIVNAFRHRADLTNCILYTTDLPCNKCAKMIVQTGIKTVVHGGKGSEMQEEAKKIFYWAKVAILEYEKPLTRKPTIEIDLHGLTVTQKRR